MCRLGNGTATVRQRSDNGQTRNDQTAFAFVRISKLRGDDETRSEIIAGFPRARHIPSTASRSMPGRKTNHGEPLRISESGTTSMSRSRRAQSTALVDVIVFRMRSNPRGQINLSENEAPEMSGRQCDQRGLDQGSDDCQWSLAATQIDSASSGGQEGARGQRQIEGVTPLWRRHHTNRRATLLQIGFDCLSPSCDAGGMGE